MVVFVRGYRATIGGYARFKAAVTVANRKWLASPKTLIAASGNALRDYDWKAGIQEDAGTLDPVGDVFVAKTVVRNQPAWIAAGMTQDKQCVASVYVLHRHDNKQRAIELLKQVLTSIKPSAD